MKVTCNVMEDLLPMYYDEVCSEETAAMVKEHLNSCPSCRRILTDLQSEIEMPAVKPDDIKPLLKIRKRYKRTKQSWLAAVILTLALIPLAFLSGNRQGVHAAQNDIAAEDNALAIGNAFICALVDSDYTKAFTYWDIETEQHELSAHGNYSEANLADLKEACLEIFCTEGEALDALGGISNYQYISMDSNYAFDHRGDPVYFIRYEVNFAGNYEEFCLTVTKNGINGMIAADGLIDHPLSQFCLWGRQLYNAYTT